MSEKEISRTEMQVKQFFPQARGLYNFTSDIRTSTMRFVIR